MHVHAAHLGAAMQRRDRLAGVEQPIRIERALDVLKALELAWRELHAHVAELLYTDAVLAGDRTARLDAKLQYLRAKSLRFLLVARMIGIVEDEGMEIAVASVENVHAAQPELLRQLGDSREHRSKCTARNGAVDAVVVGRDASRSRERGLAPGPEAVALLRIARHLDARRAAFSHQCADRRSLLGHLLGDAVRFTEQDRRRVT